MGAIGDIQKSVKGSGKLNRQDDGAIPKINRFYCVAIMILMLTVISSVRLVGKTIACWCPGEFKGHQVKYTNDYCWTRNTYFVPYDESIPDEREDREERRVVYYQWVPIIFLLQSLLFIIPRWFWVIVRDGAGINLKKALNSEKEDNIFTQEEKENVVSYIDKWIHIRDGKVRLLKNSKTRAKKIVGDRAGGLAGSYLCLMYFLSCVLYLVSTLSQIFILDSFLQNGFLSLGTDFLSMMLSTGTWVDTTRFPRQTLCDVDVRQLTNVLPYTVQCSLPINLFHERMFIMVWFLLVVMTVLNFYNVVHFGLSFFVPGLRKRYIQKKLTLCSDNTFTYSDAQTDDVVDKFLTDYLKHDGVFVIWTLSNNMGPVITNDMVDLLWKKFNDTLNNDKTHEE